MPFSSHPQLTQVFVLTPGYFSHSLNTITKPSFTIPDITRTVSTSKSITQSNNLTLSSLNQL